MSYVSRKRNRSSSSSRNHIARTVDAVEQAEQKNLALGYARPARRHW